MERGQVSASARLLVVAVIAGCAGVTPRQAGPGLEPFDYAESIARARTPDGAPRGALAECRDRWVGALASARSRVFSHLAGRVREEGPPVLLVELGGVADYDSYGYVLVVGDIAVRGLVSGAAEAQDIGATPLARALRTLTPAELAALESDQSADPEVNHGFCTFVTIYRDGRRWQFAHYAAFRTYRTPAEQFLRLVEPLGRLEDVVMGSGG